MKKMRKALSLLLVLVMVLGLGTSAFAADSYTVTVNNATGHSYVIYQIFTGDLSGDPGEEVLANLKYGADYQPEGATGLVPKDVLDTIEATATTIQPTGAGTDMVIEGDTATYTAPAAGYYMIVDVTETLPEGDTRSAVIFQVVGDTEITSKHGGTTIEKKVQDINDSTGEYTEDATRPEGEETWIDSADYDINDIVPFKSTANFEGLDNYETCEVVFTDIMAKGLDYNEDMKVWVNSVDKTDEFTITPVLYTSEDEYNGGTQITVSCNDITAFVDGNAATIVLEYSAVLGADANIGEAGNPNKIKVKTIPDGEGEKETPWDVNIVFTYKAEVNKVDQDKKPLTGAEFTLEKYVAATDEWVAISKVAGTEGDIFTFNGLDDGNYRITETVTPTGYNSIDPIYFTVTAEHDVVAADPALTSLQATQSKADKESGSVAEFEVTLADGEVSTDVVNNQGVELPETGGIGTTIFYIVGGILVLGAVVLLVTKKRMSAEA